DVEPCRCAERIECVGPRACVATRGPAEHRLRCQACDAGPAGGLEELTRFHREERDDRAEPCDRHGGDAEPILERTATDVDQPASGMKWPTVRDRSTKVS